LQPETLDALRRWAEDDLRSMNSQIEFLLKQALEKAGRSTKSSPTNPPTPLTNPPTNPTSTDTDPPKNEH
jgi:hypothetical protein